MKKYEKVFKLIQRNGRFAYSCTISEYSIVYDRLQYSTRRFTEKKFELDSNNKPDFLAKYNLGIFCFKTLEQARDFIGSYVDLKNPLEIFQAIAENPREVSNYREKGFPKGTMLAEKLKLVKRYL